MVHLLLFKIFIYKAQLRTDIAALVISVVGLPVHMLLSHPNEKYGVFQPSWGKKASFCKFFIINHWLVL